MGQSIIPLEDDECYTLAEYLETLRLQGKVRVYTHTANETYTKSWKQKRRNTRMGVKPGIPDYIIVTSHDVLFIEMKRTTSGQLSKHQKVWLRELDGKPTKAVMCRGFDEARKYIEAII